MSKENQYSDWFEFKYQDDDGSDYDSIAACAFDSENIQLFFDHHIGKPEDDDLKKGDLIMRVWANMPSLHYAGNFHHEQDKKLIKAAQENSLKRLIEALEKIKEEAELALEKL